jgi:hypothetical protein
VSFQRIRRLPPHCPAPVRAHTVALAGAGGPVWTMASARIGGRRVDPADEPPRVRVDGALQPRRRDACAEQRHPAARLPGTLAAAVGDAHHPPRRGVAPPVARPFDRLVQLRLGDELAVEGGVGRHERGLERQFPGHVGDRAGHERDGDPVHHLDLVGCKGRRV